MILRTFTALVLLLALAAAPASSVAQSPQDILDQAEIAFAEGRIEASLEKFDRLAELVPDVAPLLWQRGIALYELGRYRECAAQFASHYTVNPTDAENAAWHFLCVARAESPARARESLLRAGPDPRVMRMEILSMLRGTRTPEDVMTDAFVLIAEFYAHLYVGLYYEATGNPEAALPHLTAAASERYQAYGGFMNVVAQVHLRRINGSRR
jgi:lipoprotein NlpI